MGVVQVVEESLAMLWISSRLVKVEFDSISTVRLRSAFGTRAYGFDGLYTIFIIPRSDYTLVKEI
jgi:hypothetical protein